MAEHAHDLWAVANSRLDQSLTELRATGFDELFALTDAETSQPIEVNSVKLQLSIWARKEQDGSVGVVAEIRRYRFLGWSQVSAKGFYAHPDGRKVEMINKNLWDHGY